jgi:hypothetical protein
MLHIYTVFITVHFRFSRGGSSAADAGADQGSKRGLTVFASAEGHNTPPLVDDIDVLSSCIVMKQGRRCLRQSLASSQPSISGDEKQPPAPSASNETLTVWFACECNRVATSTEPGERVNRSFHPRYGVISHSITLSCTNVHKTPPACPPRTP